MYRVRVGCHVDIVLFGSIGLAYMASSLPRMRAYVMRTLCAEAFVRSTAVHRTCERQRAMLHTRCSLTEDLSGILNRRHRV